MNYNFDEIIDRKKTNAMNTDGFRNYIFHAGPEMKFPFPDDEFIRMWVADMDFRTPPFIIKALRDRLENEILGYTVKPGSWYDSIISWVDQRYGWKVSREMMNFTPGIVPGLAMLIQSLTRPGDKVMVQPPVYHPFFLITQHNNREVVYNPLVLENGQFRMDMA